MRRCSRNSDPGKIGAESLPSNDAPEIGTETFVMNGTSTTVRSSRLAQALEVLEAATPITRSAVAGSAEILNMGSVANRDLPFPLLIERSDGPYLFDMDGNRYIDGMLGFGTWVAGHKPPGLIEAITAQLERGLLFGIHNPMQERLAELLLDAGTGERVIFCSTGTEATMYAIRAARAFTGRNTLAMLDGFYHGAHDYGTHSVDVSSPRDRPRALFRGAGIPPQLHDLQLMLPHRNPAAFDLIVQHKDELAAVLVEGIQSSNPHRADDIGEFYREIQALCRRHGILFVVDEVITGFRQAYGGAQEYYGLEPDLATYGKAIGGGTPVGAVAGRADVMAVFSGPGAHPRGIFSGGSFSGNPLGMAAGVAHVSHLRENREEIYPYIDSAGTRLGEAFNSFARENGMRVQMLTRARCSRSSSRMPRYAASATPPMSTARPMLTSPCICCGAACCVPAPSGRSFSHAHTPAVIDAMVEAMTTSLLDLRADGKI